MTSRPVGVTLRGFVIIAVVAVAGVLAVAGGARSDTTDKPDLIPIFPSVPYATQTTPFYVDAYTEPGALLYRFDAVLFNQGGALDVYRDPVTGHVMQAIWAGGTPSVMPDPNTPPPTGTPGLTVEDLTARGAQFQYVTGPDHDHFHLKDAARYELLAPGIGVLPAAKVGFCLGDDWGTPTTSFFPYPYTGPGLSWCAVGHPEATFFREGISPQAGDLYNSQIQFQWIDVSGLRPGTYTLQGIANPDQIIDESNLSNDTTTTPRVIPGVLASSLNVHSVAAAHIKLKAAPVGPLIPARSSENCFPRSGASTCLVTDAGQTAITYHLVGKPCSGRVSLTGTGATTAAAYAPRGAATIDGFTYTATDHRGLTSLPAFVRLGRSTRSGSPSACLIGGNVGPDRKARVAFITTGKVPAGAQWKLFINTNLSPTSKVSASGAVSPVLPSGKTGFWLELVRNGHPLAKRIQSRAIVLNVPALATPSA